MKNGIRRSRASNRYSARTVSQRHRDHVLGLFLVELEGTMPLLEKRNRRRKFATEEIAKINRDAEPEAKVLWEITDGTGRMGIL